MSDDAFLVTILVIVPCTVTTLWVLAAPALERWLDQRIAERRDPIRQTVDGLTDLATKTWR